MQAYRIEVGSINDLTFLFVVASRFAHKVSATFVYSLAGSGSPYISFGRDQLWLTLPGPLSGYLEGPELLINVEGFVSI